MATGNRFTEADRLYVNAMQLLSSGDPASAAVILDEITSRFDSYGRAWCELGNVLQYHLGDAEGASACYRKAMEATPGLAPAYLGYADALFFLERFAEANAILNQAMEIPGVRKDLALQKSARLMESQGRYDEAIEACREAILVSFSDVEITRCEQSIARCQVKKKYSR